jgi:hypothetical protein
MPINIQPGKAYLATWERNSNRLAGPMAENQNVSFMKASPRPAPAGVAAPAIVVPIAGVQASVKLLDLAPGLYAITIEPASTPHTSLGGMTLPATLVTPLDSEPNNAAEIFGAGNGGNWVGPAGGTVVLKIPAGGGRSLITTYRSDQQEAAPLSIQVAALGRPASPLAPAHEPNGSLPDSASAAEVTVPAEITFCIDQHCETKVLAEGWVGTPGGKRFLEAFGIVPQGSLELSGIEYKGFGPDGRETPWVSAGKLCGSRGKNVALTGFAIRPAEHLRGKYDIVYEGAFAKSGPSGPSRNGAPCRGSHTDDPLEALSLTIIARA